MKPHEDQAPSYPQLKWQQFPVFRWPFAISKPIRLLAYIQSRVPLQGEHLSDSKASLKGSGILFSIFIQAHKAWKTNKLLYIM